MKNPMRMLEHEVLGRLGSRAAYPSVSLHQSPFAR